MAGTPLKSRGTTPARSPDRSPGRSPDRSIGRPVGRGVVKPPLLPKRARAEMARLERAGGIRAVKGGDGGAAVADAMLHQGSFSHDGDNSRRHATCARVCETLYVPTADPFDVAHNQRGDNGHFLPQAAAGGRGGARRGDIVPRSGLAGCPPRLYPRSQMTSSGVAFDSMFDGLEARRQRLAADGLTTGGVGTLTSSELLRSIDASMAPGTRLRDVLHQRTTETMTGKELALERAGSAWLRKHG